MKRKEQNFKSWFKSGAPWVWMTAGGVSIAVIMTIGLLAVIAVRGLGHFWPADVVEAHYQVPGEAARVMAGELVQEEQVPRARLAAAGLPVDVKGGEFMTRELYKVGNREVYGADFSWVVAEWLSQPRTPESLLVMERREWGNFYGYLLNVKQDGQLVAEGEAAWAELQARISRVDELHAQLVRLEKKEHRPDQPRPGAPASGKPQAGTRWAVWTPLRQADHGRPPCRAGCPVQGPRERW